MNRQTSKVVDAIRDGERTVITRYGIPVAVVLSVADAFELAGRPTVGPAPRTNLELRARLRDVLRTVVGDELERRVWHGEISRYLHGRWWDG